MSKEFVNSPTFWKLKMLGAKPVRKTLERREKKVVRTTSLMLAAILSLTPILRAQAGNHTLFGDFKVDESKVNAIKPISFEVILYTQGGSIIGRQTVSSGGRFRFNNLPTGIYDIVVESDSNEVARLHVEMLSPLIDVCRQDILLEWRPSPGSEKRVGALAVSARDFYKRDPANQKLFQKAQEAVDERNYKKAISLFQQILERDDADYQSWTELGTVYLAQDNIPEAEKAYVQAIHTQPSYALALLDLGRLRVMVKNFDGAIEVLSRAVTVQPLSPQANYYLGEAYLQIKKGSKAVGYFYEALKLDPIGMAEAHLRLAALYNGAGLKDKAAAEYEEFLKKKPDYSDKKKLEQYIAANKKVSSKQ
jgi:cytochrome c-type biogenesis protein CcmH/NrfG